MNFDELFMVDAFIFSGSLGLSLEDNEAYLDADACLLVSANDFQLKISLADF